MTWLDLARAVAAEFDATLTDDEADHLLWNETGFPGFFHGDHAMACSNQLRAAFRRSGLRRRHPMRAYTMPKPAPTNGSTPP